MNTKTVRNLTIVSFAVFAAGLVATAGHTVDAIPLTPHGDAIGYNSGALPLTPTSLVVGAEGDDLTADSADDKLLIVTNVGGTPQVAATVIGRLPNSGGRFTRLSATRALYQSAGADDAWATGDETLVVVDRAGSANLVTQVVVGSLQRGQGGSHVPERLSPDTAVLAVLGADNDDSTQDDAVAVVTGIGGTPVVTPVAAPFLHASGRTQATAMTPTSFLVASLGPDGELATADDLLYLFTDVGGANTRTDIPIAALHYGRPGRPVRVTPTLAVVASEGPDEQDETADDRLFVIGGVGTTNVVTSVNIPYQSDYGSGRPRVLGPDLVVVPTWGPDGLEGTADDTLAFVSNLGTTNDVFHVTVGPIDEDRQGRPVRLTPDRVAVVTEGLDLQANTSDDRLAVISGVGTTYDLVHVGVPGLGDGGATEPVAGSATALLVVSGGPDGIVESGGDDVFTLVTGLGATPVVEHVAYATGGQALDTFGLASRPDLAGGGRAVAMGTGPDGAESEGGDDVVHVIDDLPRERDVTLKSLQIKFKAAKPAKGESYVVKASLALDDPTLFGAGDLTISIGNAAETIPAALIVTKGGKPTYKRPKGAAGFIKKMVYSPKKGTLTLSGKGVGTGGETTDAAFVPFTLDTDEWLFVGQTVSGTATKAGIKYKAPK